MPDKQVIQYRQGDLLKSGERYIMHGCNNQGLMESGIAKQIAERWPAVWNEYRNHYHRDGLKVGSFHIVRGNLDRPYVINAITQTQGGMPLSYDALVKIFSDLNTVNLGKDRVLAIPRIGAGVAGGSWPVIEEIIRQYVKTYTVRVYTPPEGKPATQPIPQVDAEAIGILDHIRTFERSLDPQTTPPVIHDAGGGTGVGIRMAQIRDGGHVEGPLYPEHPDAESK